MVLASIEVQVDPQRLDEACKAVLDCEHRLRAGGRCRHWVVTQSGPDKYVTMGFYDTESDAQSAIVEVMQSLRSFGSAVSDFSHREVQTIVVDRMF
jgi:hypothetical protein